jgi:hypothetical protein
MKENYKNELWTCACCPDTGNHSFIMACRVGLQKNQKPVSRLFSAFKSSEMNYIVGFVITMTLEPFDNTVCSIDLFQAS